LNAETSSQLRLAHKQQEAAKKLEPIRSRLIQLIARLEAAIDFAEDMESQQNRSWKDEFWTQVKEVEEQLRKLVKLTRKGMIIRSGVSVVFIGRTNVGKSSLMNQLGEFFLMIT
jgi:tRNA modification GTPase